MLRKRGGWLAVLFIGEMLTATAIGFFEHEISQAVVLALFIPLVISSGGNSGSQASTLVIRAMALGEVRLHDWWHVMRREFIIGLGLLANGAWLLMGRIGWMGMGWMHGGWSGGWFPGFMGGPLLLITIGVIVVMLSRRQRP